MDNKHTILVIAMVTGVILVLGAAAYFFSGSGAQGRKNLNTSKRLTAKPGTDRKNAQALSSNKRPAQEVTAPPKQTGEPPIPVKSLSPPDERLTPKEKKLREALNSLDPQKGIEKIDVELGLPQTPGDAARLHAARAQLALEKNPPDYESAAANLALAAQMAPTERMRYGILAHDARLWMLKKDYDTAARRLSTELERPGPISPERIRLRALLAQAREESGQLAEAEAAYRDVLREAIDYSDEPEPVIDDLIRVAGLRLSRILRDTERENEARDLARSLSARLQGTGTAP